MNVMFIRSVVGAALGAHAAGWAQSVSEGGDPGPTQAVIQLSTPEQHAQGLSLRMAVDAHYRDRLENPAQASDYHHRLTAEQRLELREQVRRAAMRVHDAPAGVAGATP